MTADRVPLARWVMRGALLVAIAFANLNDIWSPDVVPNTLMAWTLIRARDVDFDEFTDIPRDSYFFRACGPVTLPAIAPVSSPGSPRSPGGPPPPGPADHVCSIFPPGISLLALPILAPFVLLDPRAVDGLMLIRAGHLAAALIEAIAALLLWSVIRRFTTARWAAALVLLYWLATSVRTVASQALWQHAGVHLALALALWLVMHERVSVRRELLAGVVMGAGIAVRQTTAIAAAGLARLPWPPALAIRLSAPLLFALGVVIGVVPLVAYNVIAFGSPLEQGYGDKPFGGDLATGIYGLLLSPSRGLFVYEPWVIAAFASLVLSFRRTGLGPLRLRGVAIAWLALLITYARYEEWWGGRVFGPRFLDDMAPALVVALAWGIGQGILTARWARAAFTAAAAWSLLLFNVAALVYDPAGWDTLPTNVNFDPARLLVWSDPQWLAVLRSLGQAEPRVLVAGMLSVLLVLVLLRLEILKPHTARNLQGGPAL